MLMLTKVKKRSFLKEFSIKGCLFQKWTFINVQKPKKSLNYFLQKKHIF
jgi:hypothetical protein